MKLYFDKWVFTVVVFLIHSVRQLLKWNSRLLFKRPFLLVRSQLYTALQRLWSTVTSGKNFQDNNTSNLDVTTKIYTCLLSTNICNEGLLQNLLSFKITPVGASSRQGPGTSLVREWTGCERPWVILKKKIYCILFLLLRSAMNFFFF